MKLRILTDLWLKRPDELTQLPEASHTNQIRRLTQNLNQPNHKPHEAPNHHRRPPFTTNRHLHHESLEASRSSGPQPTPHNLNQPNHEPHESPNYHRHPTQTPKTRTTSLPKPHEAPNHHRSPTLETRRAILSLSGQQNAASYLIIDPLIRSRGFRNGKEYTISACHFSSPRSEIPLTNKV